MDYKGKRLLDFNGGGVIVMLILDTLKFFETKSTKCVGKSGCKAIDGFRGRGVGGTSV